MQRLHFEQVVDGMWNKGLGEKMPPQLRAALKEAGLDLGKKLDPAYPAEKMSEWIRLTAAALFPGDAIDAALRRLGIMSFHGVVATPLGAAMKEMLRAVGPRRGLERMQQNLRIGNNYMETKTRDLPDGGVEVWLNHANGVAAYYCGMIEEGARATGALDVKCTWSVSGDSCSYVVRWEGVRPAQ